MQALNISATTGWREVSRYLYGRPYVAWDTRTDAPMITEDPDTGAMSYRVAWIEEDHYAAMTRDRLASGLIGARLTEGS